METNFAFGPGGAAAKNSANLTPEQMQERAERKRTEQSTIFGEARKAMVAMDGELKPIRKRLAEVDAKIKEEEGKRKKAVALMYKIDGRSVAEVMQDSLAALENSASIPDRPGQEKIREIDSALQSLADEKQNVIVDMYEVVDRHIKGAVLEREKAIQDGAAPDDLKMRALDETLKRMRQLLDYGGGEDERGQTLKDPAVRHYPAGGGQNGGAGEESPDGEKTKQEEHRKGKLDETFKDIRKRFGEEENTEIKEGYFMKYKHSGGYEEGFATSREACDPFGFYVGERVQTPAGPAKVFGVRSGNLWFVDDRYHQDLTPFTWGLKTKKDFESKGFYKL